MGKIWVVAALSCLSIGASQERNEKWRVHEWGTFTSLQDENGRAIGAINTEDEPVPRFVHRLSGELLVPVDDLPPAFFKGAPRCHPDVTLRLETPVVYFHPPSSAALPARVDVRAEFRGGWLTEFYPKAEARAPGLGHERFEFGRLRKETVGTLEWKGLSVGLERPFPETKEAVWLAPRAVKAAPVAAPNGEAERYLFYRGVAHLDAPLAVARKGDRLEIRARLAQALAPRGSLWFPRLWLADIRADGKTAFRSVAPFSAVPGQSDTLAALPAGFAEEEYSVPRLRALRAEMRDGLVADGLHEDEADALLNTWDAAYFQSAGTRLFFLVPRAWTDHVMPLSVSVPAEVTRVMVGRIELVTPRERERLRRIAASPECSRAWYYDWIGKNPEAAKRHFARRAEGNLSSLREEKIAIPDNYLAYLELGRFRNALVLDEQKRRPCEPLRKFIQAYGLEAALVPER